MAIFIVLLTITIRNEKKTEVKISLMRKFLFQKLKKILRFIYRHDELQSYPK